MKTPKVCSIALALAVCLVSHVFASDSKDFKFAVTGVLHPYFTPMEGAAKDYMKTTGIQTIYRATENFNQEEANVIIDALLEQGYNGFAMWPGHPSDVNRKIDELAKKGFPSILITGQAKLPTRAKLCIATDVGASAAEATEHLIKAMGGKGNIVNLLGQLGDPNTAIRKKAIEGVIDKHPEVKLLAQISEVDEYEAARMKINDFIKAKGDQIDGMVCTAYVGTQATAELLTEMGNKRIRFIGIDDDPAAIQAIKEGYMTGIMTQSPYGQAYLALEGLRLLKSGYKVRDGVYFVDSGFFLVTKENADTFENKIKEDAEKMRETFAEKYFMAPE